MTITKVFGLPAHPLFAHVPVAVAAGTNVRLFQIGDSGAKVTWQRIQLERRPSVRK